MSASASRKNSNCRNCSGRFETPLRNGQSGACSKAKSSTEPAIQLVLVSPRDAYTREWPRAFHVRPHRLTDCEGSRIMVADSLDDYIEAVATALALPVEAAWKPA